MTRVILGLGYYRDGAVTVGRDDVLDRRDSGVTVDDRLRQIIRQAQADDDPSAYLWIGLYQPTAPEMAVVAEELQLPHLEVEDALNVRQRAKLEYRGGGTFAVLKVLRYFEETSDVETGQVSVFVRDKVVVTVRFGAVGELQEVRTRLESSPRLLRIGPQAVLHAVLDSVVDGYIEIADELESDVDGLQEKVFSPTRSDESQSIYRLKREVLEMKRAVSPLVAHAHDLVSARQTAVSADLAPYLRDVGDHILRVNDQVEGLDTLLGTLLSASTQRLELQQNSDMRKISAWVAIAAVPTMIAGIYGMNFDNMPELKMEYGYYAVVTGMVVVCGLLYRAFKRSGWL